jgi:hypothetical protein
MPPGGPIFGLRLDSESWYDAGALLHPVICPAFLPIGLACGGGDSEYAGRGYNWGYTIRYEARSSPATAGYADWDPLE